MPKTYTLTVTRKNGSVASTVKCNQGAAYRIAEMWNKQLGYSVTSEPELPYLGATIARPKENL
jgi:hypothetical protein